MRSNLASWIFFRPYLVIWLSLMLTCLVVLLPGSNRLPEGAPETGVLMRHRLERAILITMALAALDWLVMICLQGGLWQFLASNWYSRNTDLTERWGSLFVLYTRLSLTNQMIFTGAAALYTGLGLKQRNTRWGFTSLILFFFLIEIVFSGNRIFFRPLSSGRPDVLLGVPPKKNSSRAARGIAGLRPRIQPVERDPGRSPPSSRIPPVPRPSM